MGQQINNSKILTFGTFDKLHQGHLHFLKQANQHGQLYIVIARDKNVKKIKNKSPSQNEQQRLKQIQALPFVKKALLGHKKFSYQIIKEIKPDLICLGYDQQVNLKKLKSFINKKSLNTKIKRLKPYKPEKYKSSLL